MQKFLLFCFTLALLGCEIPFKLHTANYNDLVTAQFLIYYAFQPLQKSTFLLLERKNWKSNLQVTHTYLSLPCWQCLRLVHFFHVDVSHLEILVVVWCTTIRVKFLQIHKIHRHRRIFLSRPTSSSIIVIILIINIIVIVLIIILILRRHCELGLNVAWMLTSHRHCWSDQDILLCNSCTIYEFCAVQVRKISRYRTKVSSNREVNISIHTISNREVCIDVSQDKACFKAKFVLQY